jgi:amidase
MAQGDSVDDIRTRERSMPDSMSSDRAPGVPRVSPGTPSELCFMSATELAARIRARQLAARDLMAASLAQIERVNSAVNAIVTLHAEQAMDQARRADEAQARGDALGPLHGLPVAHKDLFLTAGMRTTFGSPVYKDFVPEQSSFVVEREQRAGAISIGKTNTPEFGAGSQTFNAVFGATRNPYDLAKTCGGSSGGAAVALACGMVPLADGSDMGGSLRNPASFCNVVGLRPSLGRVPRGPTESSWGTLSVAGPMGRTVADVALLLSVLAGPDARDPLAIGEDGARFRRPLGRDFAGVRVAWSRDLGGLPVDPAVTAALEAQRAAFIHLGCVVEEASPDFTGADECFHVLRGLEFAGGYGDVLEWHRALLKETVVWNIEVGRALSGARVASAQTIRSRLFQRMHEFMQRYEFVLAPVSQVPPFPVEQEYVTRIDDTAMETYIDWMRSCSYISLTGHPAISVPCGFTPDGLPVGIQIVGRHRDDFGVLQLAHAFEQVTHAGLRRPPVAL